MKAWAEQDELDRKRMIWHAWHTALFQRVKRLPSLESLMGITQRREALAARLRATMMVYKGHKFVSGRDRGRKGDSDGGTNRRPKS